MNILKKLTSNYLKMNKKRTLVTIIGIILSGAMISAVTTLAVSFQNFMINYEKQENGEWEACFKKIAYSNLKYIENNNQIKDTFITSDLYMAENEYSTEEYLKIEQYEEDAIKKLGEHLIKGELPKNSDEIALSKTFFDGKENEPKIGDTITFNVGYVEDVEETEDNPYGIKFVQAGTKTYKITGMVQRPYFESSADYYTGGITIMDKTTLKDDTYINAGIIMKNSKDIYKVTEELAEYMGAYTENANGKKIYNVKYNQSLLAYKGVSDDLGFNEMMYSVCGVLIVIIMVGSVMVIYNSFAISVSDRKKQFGMLSSVGATRKQIRKSVLYEGAILGAIGIPIGIICGIGGIGVTLKVVNSLLSEVVELESWRLDLAVSWPSIIIAVLLMALTIYMSVIIPARRASKITPIEAIRQVDDIKVKGKKLKTPKFIYKIFGMEGTIALKNLKRAKKRYRTTVISLVVSIVLYISVSGFVGYMYTGFDSAYITTDYDFAVGISYRSKNSEEEAKNAESEILKIDNAKRISCIKSIYTQVEIPENKLDKNIINIIKEDEYREESQHDKEKNTYNMNVEVISLNKEEYDRYLKEIGINKLENDEIIIINRANLIRQYNMETNILKMKEGESIELIKVVSDENISTNKVKIAKLTEKVPMGLESEYYNLVIFGIVSEEKYNQMLDELDQNYNTDNIYIQANEIKAVSNQLKEISNNYMNVDINVYNVQEMIQTQKNLKIVIQIFLYGFIALISAIGISNIFNTISTNISLRRREFANLKSIGMTDKQFNRMLNLECIFYGTKALLYGLPLGVLLCYIINKAFGSGIGFIFRLPWTSIIISIIAVYAVVFITMLYSSRKMKKENIIEALRADNI